ncbi:MAG: hypothetical protein Q8L92_12295, partial [Rubrivivax sp.]|nr:hypothetical protein [Rubrivivax sp.]
DDKLRVWFKPPGWRPADVAARWPRPAFELATLSRFDPHPSPAAYWAAAGLFGAVLGATTLFLWNAHLMATTHQLLAAAAIVALLWLIGRLMQPVASPLERHPVTAR